MDILSHGLWATLATRGVEVRKKQPINPWWSFLWGIFPDLFAFLPAFAVMGFQLLTGGMSFEDFPTPDETEPGGNHTLPLASLSLGLYNLSHSLVIFAIILIAVWISRKSIPYVMLGWPLHILLDIPTHTNKFFPTPALWPIYSINFNGFSWAVPWFMILNYSLLLLLFCSLMIYRRHHGIVSKNYL